MCFEWMLAAAVALLHAVLQRVHVCFVAPGTFDDRGGVCGVCATGRNSVPIMYFPYNNFEFHRRKFCGVLGALKLIHSGRN